MGVLEGILSIGGAVLGLFQFGANMANQARAEHLTNQQNYLNLLQQNMGIEQSIGQAKISQEVARSTSASYENFLGQFASTDEGKAGLLGDLSTRQGDTAFATAGDPAMTAEFRQVYGNYDIQNVMAAESGRVGGSAGMAQKENLATFAETLLSTKKQYELYGQSADQIAESITSMEEIKKKQNKQLKSAYTTLHPKKAIANAANTSPLGQFFEALGIKLW